MSYKHRIRIVFFTISIILIYGANLSAQEPLKVLAGRDAYTIKKGDTLWDISEMFLNDPFKWPEIWKINPFIVNPDLIYPGEVLTFGPDGKLLIIPAEKAIEEKVEEVTKKMAVEKEVTEVKPEPLIVSLSPLGQKRGILSIEDIEGVGVILASREGRLLMGEGDDIYVSMAAERDVRQNERFSIFDDLGEIIHPLSGETAGHRIEIIGVLEILGKKDDVYEARITASYKEIDKGARIMPYREPVKEVVIKEGNDPIDGIILTSLDDRVSMSERDIVFIDKGDKDGLEVGNLLTIYKRGKEAADPLSKKVVSLPIVSIGSLVIIEIQSATSAAMVMDSNKSIYKGDIVRSCIDCISVE
ncbi:MAG: LysM peptidoglycan-binding domain-containing protein [Thermodesulfobacteriota bacterium]